MFKQFFSILLLGLTSLPITASAEVGFIPVPLQIVNNDSEHPAQRSPVDLSFLPTIIFDVEAEELDITGNADLGSVFYSVTDENGNVVSSGSLIITNGSLSTLSLASLPTGDYTITLYSHPLKSGNYRNI